MAWRRRAAWRGGGEPFAVCNTGNDTTPPTFVADDFYAGSVGLPVQCLAHVGSLVDISADPKFANPSAGDYHVAFGLPVVNDGNNFAPDLPATDFDGNPRIRGHVVDMGVYEAP